MRKRREKHVRRSLESHLRSAADPTHDRPRRRRAARAAAREAESLGLIRRPAACERCGDQDARLQRHHPDHEEPLRVAFLCAPCHATADAEIQHQRSPSHADRP